MAFVLQGYRTLKMPRPNQRHKAAAVKQTELTANGQFT
jgi:hypothetical protein